MVGVLKIKEGCLRLLTIWEFSGVKCIRFIVLRCQYIEMVIDNYWGLMIDDDEESRNVKN